MKRIFLVFALALGLIGISHAGGLVGGGAYRMTLLSSAVITSGGGEFDGVICSTPSSILQNTQWFQFFDTAPANGAGVLSNGGIVLNSLVSTAAITPQMMWPALSSGTATAAMNFNGYDFSSWGGIHFNNGLFFYQNAVYNGGSCTIIWKREERE